MNRKKCKFVRKFYLKYIFQIATIPGGFHPFKLSENVKMVVGTGENTFEFWNMNF